MNTFPILTTITLLPLIGGVIVAGLDAAQGRLARRLALLVSFMALALALVLWLQFDPASGGLQFREQHDWIPRLGVQYFVGVDGLGLLMVLLTAIVVPLALLASGHLFGILPPRDEGTGSGSRSGGAEQTNLLSPARADRSPGGGGGTGRNPRLYYALVLFLEAGLFGTFTALNFFHWFIFWELSLVPAFFLVRLWGGSLRGAAATQFFIYTMVGSVTMLLSFLAIFLATSGAGVPGVFDFIKLGEMASRGELSSLLSANLGWINLSSKELAAVIFGGVLLGFAVKVPLMPFHTWLPVTYVEAPTPVTMLLTGVMSKMGMYGFIRVLMPIFQETMHLEKVRTTLMALAVVTIVFSAGAAFAQRDLKRILAYSSINHLGYCLLAVFAVVTFPTGELAALTTQKAAALNGVFLQMFNHGLTAATLFLFVSFLEQRAGGLRGLNDFGGLRRVAPVFCGLMGIALFSSLGLPGLNGFVGEFLIFKGVFPLAPWAASLSVFGLLITAIFILTILQRVFNGPLNDKWSGLPDLTLRERALVAGPVALMFVLGLYPQLVLGVVNATVGRMVGHAGF